MGMYKTRPREVEAHQFTGSSTSASRIKRWIEGGVYAEGGIETRDIVSLELKRGIAVTGDWIVREGNEFFVYSKENFLQKYEPVHDESVVRAPGQYIAEDVLPGDKVRMFGENLRIANKQRSGDDITFTLDDNSQYTVRNSAIMMVVEVL